ncbi:MAG: hypothetical protein H6R19_3073 [Proteobacteria bacterium]|nr:hypothetical protein [Pseudomonadota bacterium]
MATKAPACEACHKSSLSLLLLRPSPVANDPALAVTGAEKVVPPVPLFQGVTPTRTPTESRYALRLLREGYVHVYIPKPPAGVKPWQIHRVTPQADLVPETSSLFKDVGGAVSCTRSEHNPFGLKILTLPKGLPVDSSIWIAYSANLWNKDLRTKNAANPLAMQQISLAGGSPNTFIPTEESLKTSVLECALSSLKINKATDHDFPFNPIADAAKLAKNLIDAAATNPKTKGKEQAVVLRDPAGLTIELNALRMRRQELAQAAIKNESEKPDNARNLKSSQLLFDLRDLLTQMEHQRVLEKFAPITTWGQYSARPMPAQPFFGATLAYQKTVNHTWLPLEQSPEEKRIPGTLGRAWSTKVTDAQMQQEAKRESDKAWAKIEERFSEAARNATIKAFNTEMKQNYIDAVERYETDWWASRTDATTHHYFALHFDEAEPNSPRAILSCGLIYTRETSQATTPAPYTSGSVLTAYLEELKADPAQSTAIMLRGIVGNQKELIDQLRKVLDDSPARGIKNAHDNRNDKLHDIAAGLVNVMSKASDADNPGALSRLLVKYNWLSPGLGNAFGGYALAIVTGHTSALNALGASALAGAAGKWISRLEGISLVQRTLDSVLHSIINKTGLRFPMQLTREYPAGVGLYLLAGRGSHTRAQAATLIRDGRITITLLTDNLSMSKYGTDIDRAILDGAGSIETRNAPVPALMKPKPGVLPKVNLNERQFTEIFRSSQPEAQMLRKTMSGATGNLEAIFKTLDGRLALGGLFLNGLQLKQSITDILKGDVSRATLLGFLDSSSGTLGGLAAVWQVVVQAQLAAAEQAALSKIVTLQRLRIVGGALGAAGGLANAIKNLDEAETAKRMGDMSVYHFYRTSGFAFAGTIGTFIIQTVGALADRLLTRGVKNTLVRKVLIWIARYVGAEGIALSMVEGWGVALLALALVTEVGALAMMPSELQKWASNSRFGTGSDSDKFKSWEQEEAALKKLLTPDAPKPGENKDVETPYAIAPA